MAYLGWTVTELESGKWLARVKIPRQKGLYESKVFPADEKRQATDWAKDGAAAHRLGVKRGGAYQQVLTAEVAADFVSSLQGLGRAPSHTADIARNMARMALAVPNLAAPTASAQIETWLAQLRSDAEVDGHGQRQPLSPATRNKILAEARAMCRWAINKRRMTSDPTDGIARATVPDRLPPVFSLAELRRALSESEAPYHRLFALMVYSGMRVQEASGLHWEDIDWSGECIVLRIRDGVKIKGMKERLIPLQEELRYILEMPWPATRRRGIKNPMKVIGTPAQERRGAMFAGRGFNPFRGMANFLHVCGIPIEDRSPHACRHTYGSLMSAAGMSLALLKTYMGHEAVSTTTIYTELSTRYESTARGWTRGRLQIMQGATCPVRPVPAAAA